MRFSINNVSPLAKFLIGITFIFIAFILDKIGGYGFLQGFLEGFGGGLLLTAAIGFYKIHKEKINKS